MEVTRTQIWSGIGAGVFVAILSFGLDRCSEIRDETFQLRVEKENLKLQKEWGDAMQDYQSVASVSAAQSREDASAASSILERLELVEKRAQAAEASLKRIEESADQKLKALELKAGDDFSPETLASLLQDPIYQKLSENLPTIHPVHCVPRSGGAEERQTTNIKEWKYLYQCRLKFDSAGLLMLTMSGHQKTSSSADACIAAIAIDGRTIDGNSYTNTTTWVPSFASRSVDFKEAGEHVVGVMAWGKSCSVNVPRIIGFYASFGGHTQNSS